MIKEIEEARKAFVREKPDLVINEVPEQTLTNFKKLAEEQFKNKQGFAHYGYTLKFIMDVFAPNTMMLEERISALEAEIDNLKNKNPEKVISLGDGRKIKVMR